MLKDDMLIEHCSMLNMRPDMHQYISNRNITLTSYYSFHFTFKVAFESIFHNTVVYWMRCYTPTWGHPFYIPFSICHFQPLLSTFIYHKLCSFSLSLDFLHLTFLALKFSSTFDVIWIQFGIQYSKHTKRFSTFVGKRKLFLHFKIVDNFFDSSSFFC